MTTLFSARSHSYSETCGKIDESDFPTVFHNVKSQLEWNWLVIILGFDKNRGKFQKCLGVIINEGNWVLADGTCMKNLKATEIKVILQKSNEELEVNFIQNDYENDLSLISIKENHHIGKVREIYEKNLVAN